MIVYNVKARFFAYHGDADTYRKAEKLPPAALEKIRIDNRDELAAFLDGLFAWPSGSPQTAQDARERPAAAAYTPDAENAPDWVPEFIREDWRKRAAYRKGD